MDKPNDRIQLLSSKTLSKQLSLSVRQLRRLNKCGKIPRGLKIAGSLRWRQSEISLFLDCGCDMDLFNARNREGSETDEN